MGAHFFPRERLEARRDQPQNLVVGQNRPEKELGGKLGFGTAQLPPARGAAEVAGNLTQNTRRTLRVEDTAQVRHAGRLGDHDPVERQKSARVRNSSKLSPSLPRTSRGAPFMSSSPSCPPVIRAERRRTISANNSSLLPKCRYRVSFDAPARAATSCMVVSVNPRSKNIRSAIAAISSRRFWPRGTRRAVFSAEQFPRFLELDRIAHINVPIGSVISKSHSDVISLRDALVPTVYARLEQTAIQFNS